MRILLVRHGETDWNRQGRCQGSTDLELNPIGIRQAQELAQSLSGETIEAVYSSSLKRAVQTAQAIGQPHGLPLTIEDRFRELDHGKFEGLTFPDIRAAYPGFIQKWREEPSELIIPGGERLVDVANRAWEGMNRIVRDHHHNATLVVVSHNFPILAILCRIRGVHLDQYRTFHISPCSVSRISYARSKGWKSAEICVDPYSSSPTREKSPI